MKKRGIKKVISWFVTIVLILSSVLCFTVVTKSIVSDDPSVFGFRYFYVVSGSMEPTIHVGSVVLVKKSSSGYQIDDVITFESSDPGISGNANTHRIVGIDEMDGETYYITKGDANNIPDDYPVAESCVYGKVLYSTNAMEWMGTFFEFLSTPIGFFFIILIPILLICVFLLKDFVKVYRGELQSIREQAMAQSQENAEKQKLNENDTAPDDHGNGEER